MAELLAPVGSKDKLKAAVYSGADAVYLGLKRFSARDNAANFEIAEIPEVVEFCHSFGVSVYIALNTLITDLELRSVENMLGSLSEAGVDAVIVQDLGVLDFVRKANPNIRIHASTQMSVHTPGGAELLKWLGVSRVVLAREMTLEEIEAVCKTGIEVEVFVHGALCYCVSGQCLMSSMLGGRSANRGVCAQPCRLPFSVLTPPTADLSLKDLCAISMVDKLKEIGVHSFKIEGRMKRPEYVAAATSAYRSALDGETPDTDQLLSVFSRGGFTDGYIENKRGRQMFGVRTKEDAAPEGLYARIKEGYRRPLGRFGVGAKLSIKAGEPVELTLKDDENEVQVFGEVPQKATGSGLDPEKLKNSVGKLGATAYYLNEFELDADNGMYISMSGLNELRREATQKLILMRVEKKGEPAKVDSDLQFGVNPKAEIIGFKEQELKLRAECEKFEQVVCSDSLELISLDIDEILLHQKDLQPVIKKLSVLMPRTMFGSEDEVKAKLEKVKQIGVKHATVQNLGQIPLLNDFVIHGGFSLNVTNSKSANLLKNIGFTDCIMSPECLLTTVEGVKANLPLGLIGAGRLPLMVSRNCPVNAPCDQCSGDSSLVDRKGKSFPVRCKNGIAQIFNADMLWMGDRQRELKNIEFVTIKFTIEPQDKAKELVDNFERKVKLNNDYTRGLYYRGV